MFNPDEDFDTSGYSEELTDADLQEWYDEMQREQEAACAQAAEDARREREDAERDAERLPYCATFGHDRAEYRHQQCEMFGAASVAKLPTGDAHRDAMIAAIVELLGDATITSRSQLTPGEMMRVRSAIQSCRWVRGSAWVLAPLPVPTMHGLHDSARSGAAQRGHAARFEIG